MEREVTEETSRPTDMLKRLKPTLTPHYFRHNYVTLLYQSCVDPLVAMKMVGLRGYQTTANIYTHLKEGSIKKLPLTWRPFSRKEGRQAGQEGGGWRESLEWDV